MDPEVKASIYKALPRETRDNFEIVDVSIERVGPISPDWVPDRVEAKGYLTGNVYLCTGPEMEVDEGSMRIVDQRTGQEYKKGVDFDIVGGRLIPKPGSPCCGALIHGSYMLRPKVERKPCPFCGSPPDERFTSGGGWIAVGCSKCECCGPPAHTDEDAWERWNRRSVFAGGDHVAE